MPSKARTTPDTEKITISHYCTIDGEDHRPGDQVTVDTATARRLRAAGYSPNDPRPATVEVKTAGSSPDAKDTRK
jgi:hypothetical protein